MDAETTAKTAGGPLVTLSVVSHGNGKALQILLESLRRHEAADRIQLIVTDNLGADVPDLKSSGWHSLVLLRNDRPRGYASNHNAAFLHAQGEYFCVVNPDVFFIEPALDKLMQPLAAGSAQIVAPLIADSLGRIQDSFRKLPTPLELVWRRTLHGGHRVRVPPAEAVHPDWIAGIFLLMRCATFARLGGFDARYHLYFEDVDFCTRARLLGMTLLVAPLVRLRHDARRASGRDGQYLLWHLQSAYRFFTSGVYGHARSMRTRPAAPANSDGHGAA